MEAGGEGARGAMLFTSWAKLIQRVKSNESGSKWHPYSERFKIHNTLGASIEA